MKKQYLSYDDTCTFLQEAAKEHANLVQVQSIGKSWEGREILLATISTNVHTAHEKPALLFTGTIHAREWIGNELCITFIKHLLKNINFDPELQHLLNTSTLYMVPCLNPDGFEYSRNHYTFWRKNRRDNKDGTFGVDLNRNFSVGFKKVKNTTSNVYGGPSAFSEPETKAIKTFVDAHPNISIALDYHSQGNVFFPAHKFRHEVELDGSDLNLLCANMADEIEKVTGRKYGIHRGKPPAKLISGSGREYYYSKGILAAVVEVGTRNVPDFMKNMTESVNEHIPALIHALSEVRSYSKHAPKRIEQIHVDEVLQNSLSFSWEYEGEPEVYFEIYRSSSYKQACNKNNLITKTKAKSFTDRQLASCKEYFYYIRAVDVQSKIKSAFSQRIRLKTLLADDEFNRNLFPSPTDIGYVGHHTQEYNKAHFGQNSLFVGIDDNRGICYGLIGFSTKSLQSSAIIKRASISLYPLNRVGVNIERYGEWNVSLIRVEESEDIYDYYKVANAEVLHTFGCTIKSEKLTQGIWIKLSFNEHECELLHEHLNDEKLYFRIEGPKRLPKGRRSQMMQFDIGYGSFGGGIHYRPCLELVYTLPPTMLILEPTQYGTFFKDKTLNEKLYCGFDKNAEPVFTHLKFDISSLPAYTNTIITEAYISIKNKNVPRSSASINCNTEFSNIQDTTYKSIAEREQIEYIGYELAKEDLNKPKKHNLMFDTYSIKTLQQLQLSNKPANFILYAKSPSKIKSKLIKWMEDANDFTPKLVLRYIKKRRESVGQVSNLKISKEKGMIKLSWENPANKDFVGCFVVRNRFRIPRNPYDGVKLYGGPDNYTYDNFASLDIEKYYAVFTYDDVPNFSKGECAHYKPRKKKIAQTSKT